MQEKSIATLYYIEIHKLMFYKTETWNAMKLQRVKIVLMQSMFQIERPGETSCSCVSILQALPRRSKCTQSNQRSILHVRRWNSQVGIEKYQRGRKLCRNTKSKRLLGFRKETQLRNDRGALPRGRAVPNAPARTRIPAIRHGIIFTE